jgi:poly-gamma-glutamate synthesis protein (capsule biosynthesis protein)
MLLLMATAALYPLWLPPPLDPAITEYTPPRTSLLAGGDILLARQIGVQMQQADDFTLPFQNIAGEVRAADIAFGNLEGPFCPRPPFTRRGIIFRVNPRGVEGLLEAGFDVLSLANNHSYDGEATCLQFTVKHLNNNGILPAGAGKTPQEAHAPAIIERNGVRFAFLAYTYAARNEGLEIPPERRVRTVARRDPARVRLDVARASRLADVVIVSLHDGVEYTRRPDPRTRRFARAAIEAGASVVLGHHPHVARPVERYFDPASARTGWIFYSLGNFVFWQNRPSTREALMARLTFNGALLEKVEALPITIEAVATPRLATEAEAPGILSRAGVPAPLLWPAPEASRRF